MSGLFSIKPTIELCVCSTIGLCLYGHHFYGISINYILWYKNKYIRSWIARVSLSVLSMGDTMNFWLCARKTMY